MIVPFSIVISPILLVQRAYLLISKGAGGATLIVSEITYLK
jgi:hypothetical protein